MIDKSKLSKYKYLFQIYIGRDDVIHVQRYPIVYITSLLVYYPNKSDHTLSNVGLHRIIEIVGDNNVDYIIDKLYNNIFASFLAFGVTDSARDAIRHANSSVNDTKFDKHIKDLQLITKEAKVEYEEAKIKYEKAKKSLEMALIEHDENT